MPKLFAQNERVVYLGKWKIDSNFFAFVAVGATNVGSILIGMDPELSKTNLLHSNEGHCNQQKWTDNPVLEKGAYFGEFNLGSTVVLIFEAPKDFQFCIKSGDKVKVGQRL